MIYFESRADDGNGYTVTVEIQTEVPEVTPTATPTAKPTAEPPGFEAVFAIAGLLAIAYLVLRRRK
ncbi:MAG: PGF-CTERM sorting domain-containing protein [Euryarchaeota archaeon]|nr:PGF-CTERM sorting domain-containing protein [Euryarchaeota archaeon]